jgi:hypothetical protein
MGLETLGRYDAVDSAIGFEEDLAFRKVQIERLPVRSRALQGLVCSVKRAKHGFNKRLRDLVSAPADRSLCLLIGKALRLTHHNSMERVRSLAAVGTDHHANC